MRFKVLCSAACIVGLLGCCSEKKLSVEKAESFPNGAKKKENYFYQDGLKKDIVRTVYYFQNGAYSQTLILRRESPTASQPFIIKAEKNIKKLGLQAV